MTATESVFVDIGSGLGKPQLHAFLRTGCLAYGVEVNPGRVKVAYELKSHLFKELPEVKEAL
jgi:hypothetical protein